MAEEEKGVEDLLGSFREGPPSGKTRWVTRAASSASCPSSRCT